MAKKRSTAVRRAESQAASARAAAIRKEYERKERRRRSLIIMAVVVVALVIIGVVATSVRSRNDTSGQAATTVPSGTVGKYAVPAGPASAPVKVVLYEDFMCPICGELEAASRTRFQKDIDQGKVQLQYHVMNFLDNRSSTEYSSRAANALAVVLDTAGSKAAKKFHDLLYEHQPQEGSAGLSDAQLIDYAVQAGANRSSVTTGIHSRKFQHWVENVDTAASKAGVTGTPTAVVDGKTVQWTSVGDLATKLQTAIDAG